MRDSREQLVGAHADEGSYPAGVNADAMLGERTCPRVGVRGITVDQRAIYIEQYALKSDARHACRRAICSPSAGSAARVPSIERRQLQPAQPIGVRDDVDPRDLAAFEFEAD